MTLARIAIAVSCALVCGCASMRQTTPRVLVVDPRLEFTTVDVAAIDPASLESARALASRRRPPVRDVAEYDLEIEFNGSVLSRTLVQITPLPGGLDLIRHPLPGPDSNDPPQMESSIGVAGAINVVFWRGVIGYARKKPRTAARILGVDGDPFGPGASSWTIRIDRQRAATSYRTCALAATVDAATLHPSFSGRAIRFRCTTDEIELVEWLWFVESLQRYFPGGASLPNEGEVIHRLADVRYRAAD